MKTYSFHSLVLSTLFIMVHQATTHGGIYAPAVPYNVGAGDGAGPAYAVGADANSDGKTELLISANIVEGTITVLTNNGSGAFGASQTVAVGNGPQCVAAADVNGDGRIELFSANTTDNSITVLTNNGSGRFGSNTTFTVGEYPLYVTTADVNGDSKLDVICANFRSDGYGNTLSVWTNNGTGRFGSNATLVVGNGPYAVAVADVNGDGKVDLISVNASDSTLSVLTNNGTGRFGYNATLTVGVFPQFVVAADVNGDGKVDLISANTGTNTLTVLTNNGSGNFVFSASVIVSSEVNPYPASVAAADVNGDGWMDLVSANFGFNASGNTLTVLTNNGSGRFGFYATLEVGLGPNSVAAVDVKGNGMPDLISANFIDNTVSLLVNTNPPVLPALVINRTGPNTFVISWPKTTPGYVLQQNSDLTGTSWPDYSGAVITNGTTKSVTINSATNKLYFRLRHP
jgi:hypothetical protein